MNENINKLILEFNKIKNMGYVKSIRKGYGGAGTTFEHLLGKKEDQLPLPDYNGIEIKTKINNSNYPISLFCANPSGIYEKETFRITEKYGYPDKILSNYNVLNITLYANKKNVVSGKFIFKIMVDYVERKIKLLIFDRYYNLIDNTTYWDFNRLEERIITKMNYLSIIDTSSKNEHNSFFYKYNNISIYKLLDFMMFLKLLERGKIMINFKIGIYRTGEKKGQFYDHGTAFQIYKDDISLIYDRINF